MNDIEVIEPKKIKTGGTAMHTRILLGLLIGAIGGVIVSVAFGAENPKLIWFVDNLTQPLGDLWLRLLLMIVIPLVFSALVLGVAGLGDVRKLGRVGLKTLMYTVVISAISVVIGISMVNLVKPGERIDAETAASLQAEYGTSATKVVGTAEMNAAKMEEEAVPV